MNIGRHFMGKWHAARALVQFIRYFQNWSAIWAAYRVGETLPPLGLRGGMILHHGPGDDPLFLFREIFVAHDYTTGDFYCPSSADTVMDIGAHIGFFTLYLQWCAPGISVHSFEPASETRQRLALNLSVNGLDEYVAVHPVAISNREGVAYLKRAPLTGHRSFFESVYVSGASEDVVPCVTLDQALEVCDVERIDLVKIDVEGAEIEILEGARRDTWARIDRITLEFHDLFRPGCRNRVTRLLTTHGFHKMRVRTFLPLHNIGIIQASR